MTASLLSLREVTKTYPGSPPLTVLKDVNVSIGSGEDVAIVGPSGSGKTTMLSIMGTLDHATSGDIWIDGVDVSTLSEAARARLRAQTIGFVFQQFFLLPTLSAVDNVAEGMLYSGTRRSERRKRAMEALDRVGLTKRAGHRPSQLSGGEQQRVAIARAIAGNPRLLFADEPTGALDQTAGHLVVDYLQSVIADGTTIIVITHDQALAARFTRRISLLDGTIVADEFSPTPRSPWERPPGEDEPHDEYDFSPITMNAAKIADHRDADDTPTPQNATPQGPASSQDAAIYRDDTEDDPDENPEDDPRGNPEDDPGDDPSDDRHPEPTGQATHEDAPFARARARVAKARKAQSFVTSERGRA